MSVAAINTKVDEAITLQEAGDYAGAAVKLRSALLIMGALPDSSKEGVDMRWKPETLQAMLKEFQRLSQAASGFSQTLVEYTRTGADDDFS